MATIERHSCPCGSCDGSGWRKRYLGADLQAARVAAGLSYRELAARFGLSAAYLHQCEHDACNIPEHVAEAYRGLEVAP